MNTDLFDAKTAEEEHDLIAGDDNNFTLTKRYLEPLISQTLNHYRLPGKARQKLIRDLIFIDIPIAAKRFLSNKENRVKNIKFSAYFTWYIAQRLNLEVVWYQKIWKKIKTIF